MDLVRAFLEAAQELLEGAFNFLALQGRGSDGRLVSALLLLVIGGLVMSFTNGYLGRLLGAFVAASGIYGLAFAIGLNRGLSMLLGTIFVGVIAAGIAKSAWRSRGNGKRGQTGAWVAGGSIIAAMALFASLGFVSQALPNSQLDRTYNQAVRTFKNFVSQFSDAANAGRTGNRDNRQNNKQHDGR